MSHHRAGLARILSGRELSPGSEQQGAAPATFDDETITAIFDNLVELAHNAVPFHAVFTPRERAMLGYALKLTATPARMCLEDLAAMREAGLDDGEILDVNQVTAYFAYVNRLVDGLGLQLESFFQDRPSSLPGA